MLKKKIKLSLILIILVSFIQNAFSLEPNIFVQSTVNRASQVLSDDTSKKQKIEKLKIIAKDTVDIKGVGFYSLGKFRKGLNDSQKKNTQIFLKNIF